VYLSDSITMNRKDPDLYMFWSLRASIIIEQHARNHLQIHGK